MFGWNISETNFTLGGLFGYCSSKWMVSLKVPTRCVEMIKGESIVKGIEGARHSKLHTRSQRTVFPGCFLWAKDDSYGGG